MSLIIKGMSLPLPGDVMVCALIDDKLQCTIVTRNKPIEWCEALEIPAPHGRLIDADKLIKFIQDGINKEHDSFGYDGVEILTEVQFSQTIIEAEVSE